MDVGTREQWAGFCRVRRNKAGSKAQNCKDKSQNMQGVVNSAKKFGCCFHLLFGDRLKCVFNMVTRMLFYVTYLTRI